MKYPLIGASTLAFALVSSASPGLAQAKTEALDKVLDVNQAKVEDAQSSQTRIDKLAAQTQTLLQQFKTVNKQNEGLSVYNQRLQGQINDQQQRLQTIDDSIAQVTVIQRQIMPLLIEMVASLEQFVALDVPFLTDERQQRIAFLKDNINRSELSTAEKFRQVLEAYKIENEYGRKIDSYKGTVDIDGQPREVTFFRVGRIALLYQTTDTQVSGAWDQASRQWLQLPNEEYRSALQKGLRIARKQASIDILKLPVAAPEVVSQ